MKARIAAALSRRDFLRLSAAGSLALAGGRTLARAADLLAARNGRPLGVALVGLGK